MTRRFLIVDDHFIVRSALKAIISEAYFNCIVDESQNGIDCLKKVQQNRYDLVITDLHMPHTNPQLLVQEMHRLRPGMKIMIFTMLDELVGAPKYFQLGVDGYLSKSCEENEIIPAIKNIIGNRKYISLSLRDRVACDYSINSFANPADILTAREKQVARLLVNGERNKDIQTRLDLHHSTISTVRTRIFMKLRLPTLFALKDFVDLYL